ncbi:MAG: hypothetical protein N7Q72_01910, partial [Spiroplasma sp. Tabriz.8]|nr:hypothetical protein [Candidatus Regiella insecticola]MCZ8631999.1 hypothetical protein [Spiroplasma sp. Tabriz.8]
NYQRGRGNILNFFRQQSNPEHHIFIISSISIHSMFKINNNNNNNNNNKRGYRVRLNIIIKF